jgi:ankyrin repeat protein
VEDEILRDGYRPLHKAVEKGHVEIVRVLLDAGARIDAPDINGFTPLHVAVKCGQLETVRELLERRANIDSQSYQARRTPLQLAVKKDDHRMVSLLRARGADMYREGREGKTALSYARERNDGALLNLLLDPRAASAAGCGLRRGPDARREWREFGSVSSHCVMIILFFIRANVRCV